MVSLADVREEAESWETVVDANHKVDAACDCLGPCVEAEAAKCIRRSSPRVCQPITTGSFPRSLDGYEVRPGSDQLRRRTRTPAALDGRNVVSQTPTQKLTLIYDNATRQVRLRWDEPDGRWGALLLKKDRDS